MANKIILTKGSITKDVKLSKVERHVQNHTYVSEEVDPYADYYGQFPRTAKPNSLFFFTKPFYTLEKLLIMKENCKDFFGYTKNLDIATAILDFTDHYHYAIRVDDFPDYEHIQWFQTCYRYEGVKFCNKVHITEKARVTVFKNLDLEKLQEGIFIDRKKPHKGYIIIPGPIDISEFKDFLVDIRNNNDCELFDAAIGTIDLELETRDMVRIYSENLNIKQLVCIKKKFSKMYLGLALQH
jgi:hypothetical protein